MASTAIRVPPRYRTTGLPPTRPVPAVPPGHEHPPVPAGAGADALVGGGPAPRGTGARDDVAVAFVPAGTADAIRG